MYQPIFSRGLNGSQLRLSNTMRQLWNEHVLWTRMFILSTAFNLPDLQFVADRLMQNPDDFADALKPYYGERKAAQFKQLLTEHLSIAGKLVNTAKAGNTTEADLQRRSWYMNAEDIARFLAMINRYWSEKEWKDMLFEHLRLTEEEAAYILGGKYFKSIDKYDEIQAEAMKMADVMTDGIIRQFRV